MAEQNIILGVITKGIDRAKQEFQNLQKTFKETEEKGGTLGKAIGALGSITIAKSIATSVYDFGKAAVDAAGKAEGFRNRFVSLEGSVEGAEARIRKLTEFANKSPFQLEGIVDASAALQAYGLSADETDKKLNTLGDIAAQTGKPLNEFVQIFIKAQSQGKVTNEVLDQLGERGINVAGILAKNMGVASTSIRKMSSDGKISVAELEKAFTQMTEEGGFAFGAMERQGTSFSGRMSALEDNFEALLTVIGNKLLPVVGEFIEGLISTIDWLKQNEQLLPIVGGALLGVATAFAAIAVKAGLAWLAITGPVALVIGAVALVGAAVAGLIVNWDKLVEMKDRAFASKEQKAAMDKEKADLENHAKWEKQLLENISATKKIEADKEAKRLAEENAKKDAANKLKEEADKAHKAKMKKEADELAKYNEDQATLAGRIRATQLAMTQTQDAQELEMLRTHLTTLEEQRLQDQATRLNNLGQFDQAVAKQREAFQLEQQAKLVEEQAVADELDTARRELQIAVQQERNAADLIFLQTHLATLEQAKADAEVESLKKRGEHEKALQVQLRANANQRLADQRIENLQKKQADDKLLAERVAKYGEFGKTIHSMESFFADERVQGVNELFGNMSQLTRDGNKDLFRIGKAAAIANATLDMFAGISKALGSAPPPINFANAGVVGTLGALQIDKISATKYSVGGVVKGSSMAGDKNYARLNAGEEVLTPVDRKRVIAGLRERSMAGYKELVSEVKNMKQALMSPFVVTNANGQMFAEFTRKGQDDGVVLKNQWS